VVTSRTMHSRTTTATSLQRTIYRVVLPLVGSTVPYRQGAPGGIIPPAATVGPALPRRELQTLAGTSGSQQHR